MEQFLLLIILGLVFAGLLFFVYSKPDLAKKYWGFVVGGFVSIAGLGFLLLQGRRGSTGPDPEMAEKEEQLKTDLQKVHEEAEAEITVAREAEQEVQAEVVEIQQISDESERLARLADLFNRTRRRK